MPRIPGRIPAPPPPPPLSGLRRCVGSGRASRATSRPSREGLATEALSRRCKPELEPVPQSCPSQLTPKAEGCAWIRSDYALLEPLGVWRGLQRSMRERRASPGVPRSGSAAPQCGVSASGRAALSGLSRVSPPFAQGIAQTYTPRSRTHLLAPPLSSFGFARASSLESWTVSQEGSTGQSALGAAGAGSDSLWGPGSCFSSSAGLRILSSLGKEPNRNTQHEDFPRPALATTTWRRRTHLAPHQRCAPVPQASTRREVLKVANPEPPTSSGHESNSWSLQ